MRSGWFGTTDITGSDADTAVPEGGHAAVEITSSASGRGTASDDHCAGGGK